MAVAIVTLHLNITSLLYRDLPAVRTTAYGPPFAVALILSNVDADATALGASASADVLAQCGRAPEHAAAANARPADTSWAGGTATG